MAGVSGIGRASAGSVARGRGGAAGTGFVVAAEALSGTEAAPRAAPVELSMMLALQEAGAEPVQDRAARRQARAMLHLLGVLQRSLLGCEDDPTALGRLADLSAAVPAAADPAMRKIVDAIVLRARLEVARLGKSPERNRPASAR